MWKQLKIYEYSYFILIFRHENQNTTDTDIYQITIGVASMRGHGFTGSQLARVLFDCDANSLFPLGDATGGGRATEQSLPLTLTILMLLFCVGMY